MDKQDLSKILKPGDKVYIKTAYAGYIVREVESIKRGTITLVCGSKFDRYGEEKDVAKWKPADRLLPFEDGRKADLTFQINLLRREKEKLLKVLEGIDAKIAALTTQRISIG